MSSQIFHHFSKWEDYKAGFYDTTCKSIDEHIRESVELLSNQDKFYKYAKRVISEWAFSCEQNLTDGSINKIAYIGQSACCLANSTPSFVTKKAWAYISEENQNLANQTAKEVLNEWRINQDEKGGLWAKSL